MQTSESGIFSRTHYDHWTELSLMNELLLFFLFTQDSPWTALQDSSRGRRLTANHRQSTATGCG